jgi:hypothetical protein
MAAWAAIPHVAQPLATLDPNAATLAPTPSATTAADSAALLARARPVIRALAEAANFPDLVTKPTTHRALSNLGDFLIGHRDDPVRGEAHRALLMDAVVDEETVLSLIDEEGRQTIDRPRATLKRKPLRRLSIEEMDALEDPVDRLKCVPIRGQAAVATVSTGLMSTGAEVEIVYTTGASVTLRRNADVPGDPRPSVSMAIKSITKQHKIISGQLDAGLALVVEELFSRDGVVPLPPGIDPKDDFAHAVLIGNADKPAYYDMPAWFQEHLGCLAEELFRLHALLTAAHCVGQVRSGKAKAGVDVVRARTVCVDRAMLFEQFDQKKFKRESGLALKVVLHAASARCVCAAHHRAARAPVKRVVLVLRICGRPVGGPHAKRCPVHACADESPAFPGVCCLHPRAELVCEHDLSAGGGGAGLRLPLRLDTDRGMLVARELMCAAAALAAQAPPSGAVVDQARRARVSEVRMSVDAAMTGYRHACAADGATAGLLAADERAVNLLCAGEARVRKRVAEDDEVTLHLTGKSLKKGDRALAPTHGSLFPLAAG